MGFRVAPLRPRAATIVAVIWLYVGASWLGLGSVLTLLFNGIATTLDSCATLGKVSSTFGTTTYFDPTRVIAPFVAGLLLSLPFAFMAKSLRSEEVRFAVRDAENERLAKAWK